MTTGDADEFFSDERTTAHTGSVGQLSGSYRDYVADPQDPVVAQYRGQRYDEYSAERTSPDFVQELLASWDDLYREPFRGITTDGVVRQGLYRLPETSAPDPAPRLAAERLLAALDADRRDRLRYDIGAADWRAWSNPEFVIYPVGLRLEDQADDVVEKIHDVLRQSLSEDGYERVRRIMSLNGLLGELVELPTIMNDQSYWFSLFGTPSDDAPWGWQIFGHHLAVNFVSVGGRDVIAPVFLGAEPAVTGDGLDPFAAREASAVALASSLTPAQRERAVVYAGVLDPAMPVGRLHPADERHVAGAFHDNRVVPFEGMPASSLDDDQIGLLLQAASDSLALLRPDQLRATLADVARHLDETYVAWYGATDGSEPFYLRIHSPVLLAELDHHAGVWLTNRLPARFHVHTTLRLPNGNDYGRTYIDEWTAAHPDPTPTPTPKEH